MSDKVEGLLTLEGRHEMLADLATRGITVTAYEASLSPFANEVARPWKVFITAADPERIVSGMGATEYDAIVAASALLH